MPEYKVVFLHDYDISNLASLLERLHITDPDLAGRLIWDEENPDYIVATEACMRVELYCKKLRHYLNHNKNSIFIFSAAECIEPDMNIFDYAVTWSPELKCGDRFTCRISNIYNRSDEAPYRNELTREEAANILQAAPAFCNFIYRQPYEHRDLFFHLLSQYKKVDSMGPHLNNMGNMPTRNRPDWYDLSIDMKKGYKFSVAIENASYRGYMSEKIITSLRAHTVPIYWGDPAVTDLINPKAFVNCHDYSSFEEVIERVKEIDHNDDLWLDMITQPWQTEEQYQRTIQMTVDHDSFVRNIFSQDIKSARRRTSGGFGDFCQERFTGFVGVMPPLCTRVLGKIRGLFGKLVPKGLRPTIKAFLGLDA